LGSRGGRVRRALLSPTTRTLVIVTLIASSSSYYAVFFLTLLGCTGLIVLFRDRSWRRFWGAALVGAATVTVMLVNMAPDLLFSWEHGSNPAGLERSAGEAEFYALKFAQLVLPWSGHQIGIFAHLRGLYDSGYVSLGEQPALGLVAAVGFIASFVLVALVAGGALRVLRPRRLSSRLALATGISTVILVAFMFATLGGVSTLISVVTSSLRGWNRMSIVIAILSLALLGLLLDAAVRKVRIARLSPRQSRALAAGGLSAVLLIVGFVDQTPGDSDAHYETNAARYWSDDAYFGELRERLSTDPQVLVLPYIPFPESASESGMLASEQLIPYLHSESIAWSNGGIKGRPAADWPIAAENYGFDAVAALTVAAGFDGVLVLRQGYRDNGVAVEAALAEATGSPPLRDEQERYGFFDLGDYAGELELQAGSTELADIRARILSPVVAYAGPDYGRDTLKDGTIELVTGDGSGTFTLANDSSEQRHIDLRLIVLADPGSSATVTLPTGLTRTLTFEDGPASITIRIPVPAGGSTVTVSVLDAAGSPADVVRLAQPSVVDPVVASFLARLLSRTP
jgi:hypothetical protein